MSEETEAGEPSNSKALLGRTWEILSIIDEPRATYRQGGHMHVDTHVLNESVGAGKVCAWLCADQPHGTRTLYFDPERGNWVAHEVDGCGCVFDKWALTLRELGELLRPNAEAHASATEGRR